MQRLQRLIRFGLQPLEAEPEDSVIAEARTVLVAGNQSAGKSDTTFIGCLTYRKTEACGGVAGRTIRTQAHLAGDGTDTTAVSDLSADGPASVALPCASADVATCLWPISTRWHTFECEVTIEIPARISVSRTGVVVGLAVGEALSFDAM